MGRLNEDLMLILESEGGFSTAATCSVHMPPTPNEVVCVIPNNSIGPQEAHSGDPIRRPGCQIICRSTNWETAWDNAHIAWSTLRMYNVIVNGSKYLAIQPEQDPMDLGKDDNERRLVGFNVQIYRG